MKRDFCEVCKAVRSQSQRGAACEVCLKTLRKESGHQSLTHLKADPELLQRIAELSQRAQRDLPSAKVPVRRCSGGRLERCEGMLEKLFAHFGLEATK